MTAGLSDVSSPALHTEYRPGRFCWVGLATSDPAAASSFYTWLFGWDAEALSAAEAGGYTLLRRQGRNVAILYRQTPQARAAGAAPHWSVFVSVEDADVTAALAGALGGAAVFREPFDVLDDGRVAAIRDPMGAIVSLWQPRSRAGAELVDHVGALCWNELTTTHVARSKSFYRALFGWHYGTDGSGYMTIWAGSRRQGGIRGPAGRPPGGPPRWLPYFGVESVDRTVRAAEHAGGRVREPAAEGALGRFAVLADPQGAELGVLEVPCARGAA
jgi:uncharacterized protein